MPNLTDEQYDALITQTIEWLISASPNTIREYQRRLPDNRKGIIGEMREDLLLRVRYRRTVGLSTFFSGNLLQTLPEFEIVQFVNSIATYNPTSVIQNFQHRFPALKVQVIEEESSTWALAMILLWRSTFLLLTASRLEDYAIMLNSFLSISVDLETVKLLHAESDTLVDEVADFLSTNNYEPTQLSQDQQKKLQNYFAGLKFFPPQYYLEITSGRVGMPLLNVLEGLSTVLGNLEIGFDESGKPLPEQELIDLLWDDLVVHEQYDELKKNVDRWSENRIPDDSEVIQHYNQLQQLLTINNIENGFAQQYLHDYVSKLDAQQRRLFLADLKRFLTRSIMMEILFGPVDIDYFITTLQNGSEAGNKSDFINTLTDRFSPEEWPAAQKAMLMLASIY